MDNLWILFTLLSSVLLDLPTPVAFVCHDAGAANHIFNWIQAEASLQPEGMSDWRLLVQGPAARLWAERGGEAQVRLCHTLDEVIQGAEVLITGTGWASYLEYKSLQNARQHSLKSIAVIDHWTNYYARFVRDEIVALPDEIWVTDQDAKKLAESIFADIKIVQMPNLYLEHLTQEVYMHEKRRNGGEACLLYLMEPIREAWGTGIVNGEFIGLDYFIQNLGVIGLDENLAIRLRPHPSDPRGKYDLWIEEQVGVKISLDKSTSLAESIALSDVVVGCQTYAMVVALVAGKQVFSSIPPWAPPCTLPQEGIIKISELAQK